MPSLRLLAVLAVLGVACSDNNPPGPPGPTDKGLGDMCGPAQKCRSGLTCDATSSTCVGSMSTADGSACTIGPECQSGSCPPNGRRGTCATAGALPSGSDCKGDGDCASGLKCSFDGVTLFPR